MTAYKNRIIFIPKKNTSVMHGPEADMDSYKATPLMESKHFDFVQVIEQSPTIFDENTSSKEEQSSCEGSLLHDDFIDKLISTTDTNISTESPNTIPVENHQNQIPINILNDTNYSTQPPPEQKKMSFEDTLKQFMATPEPKAALNTERPQPPTIIPLPNTFNNSVQKVSRGIKKVRRGV